MTTADRARIEKALNLALNFGMTDGAHHKAYAIDQIVRALTGCPSITTTAKDVRGEEYTYQRQGESQEYLDLIREAKAGEYGPNTYEWDVGIPP